ncbi:MAG: septum formation initiator family protein [Elusimicrobia bacterium]|nr:septum formation initiator family protein [Elusimicrobiota bacterium]
MIKNALWLFVIAAVVLIFYSRPFLRMQDLHQKNASYEHRIRELQKENAALREEQRRLNEDPDYFERVAREKMGLIKDGEMIYKVVPAGQKKDAAE